MEDFTSYYPLLFTIASRMLHGAADAEDLVQESYLRYATAEQEISSLKSYLTTIITRLCLDYRKSARVQREQALDLLPDDDLRVADVEEVVLQALERREEVTKALRTLLERLSPEERGVFLLHEIFDYSYEEIATQLGKSAATCRQLLHRARTRLTQSSPRFFTIQEQQEQLTERFLTASQQGDEQALFAVLLQDIAQKRRHQDKSDSQRQATQQTIHQSCKTVEGQQETMKTIKQTAECYLTVPEAVRRIQAGNMVLIQDDAARENEADLVLAAQFATAEKLNFMLHKACGLICVPLAGERLDALGISLMERKNNPLQGTAFTASVDAVYGTTTGISAADRAVTIRKLVDPTACAEDFAQPGHVFPLRAHSDGTLARKGHTEAAIDLMHLAGLEPGAIVCEVLNTQGEAARGEELCALAQTWDIGILTVAAIARYRQEHIVSFVAETQLPTQEANFRLQHYRDTRTHEEYLAVILGDLASDVEQPPLVRLHSACTTGDILGSQRCDCQAQMRAALQNIAAEGRGLLLYLPQEGRGIGLAGKLQSYVLQEQGYNTVEANKHLGYPVDARSYACAIAILHDLKLRTVRLMTNSPRKIQALVEGGITVERVPLEIEPSEHNSAYLRSKFQQMGHLLTLLPTQKEDLTKNETKEYHDADIITAVRASS
jgi:3,4-dihydroxy 2-butanone 4-phosphate synthase/GTP cyclohydrolase II